MELRIEGDPISADNSESFRVTTLTTGLKALIDGKDRCPVRDISATGFAFLSAQDYHAGQIVTATLEKDNERFEGRATIQNMRMLSKGTTRYGLRVLDSQDGENLPSQLRELTLEVQRKQLRRVK